MSGNNFVSDNSLNLLPFYNMATLSASKHTINDSKTDCTTAIPVVKEMLYNMFHDDVLLCYGKLDSPILFVHPVTAAGRIVHADIIVTVSNLSIAERHTKHLQCTQSTKCKFVETTKC